MDKSIRGQTLKVNKTMKIETTKTLNLFGRYVFRGKMDIRKVTAAEVLPIRHIVLWPNKSPSFCEVEGDDSAIHYGAFVGGKLVCVASVYKNGHKARLRKFATLPEYQGQGIGSKVIENLVRDLKRENISSFWCDARTSALSFYQKFGLCVEGEEFYKSNVAYFKMSVSWVEEPQT